MLKSSPMILASIFHLWPGSHGLLDLPSYRLVCRTVRPGSFNQWTDVADRVCSVWDQMKPHRARAIKKEWGIKWRPATKMPKEAILNFTSPPASSCIKNNQCKVLGSKWFSILAASADAEIRSPPHLFSVDQKARTRIGYLNQTRRNKSIWGFHKKATTKWIVDCFYDLIWLNPLKGMICFFRPIFGWKPKSASIERSRFLRPTTSTEPPSQGSDCPQSPHTCGMSDGKIQMFHCLRSPPFF